MEAFFLMARPKIGHEKLREKGFGLEDDILEHAVFIEFVQEADGKVISFGWFNRTALGDTVVEYIRKLKGVDTKIRLTVVDDKNSFLLDPKNRIAKPGKDRMRILL